MGVRSVTDGLQDDFQKAASANHAQELVDAVSSNNPGRVRELLKAGVTTEGLELAGEHLAIFANERGFPDVVRAFVDNGLHPDDIHDRNGQSLLMGACLRRDTELVRYLVSKGADVKHTSDFQQWTPLHFAAVQDVPEIVGILVESGADMNAVNEAGQTPGDIAQPEAKAKLDEVISMRSSKRLHKISRTLRK